MACFALQLVVIAGLFGQAMTGGPAITSATTASVAENSPVDTVVLNITTDQPENMTLTMTMQEPDSNPKKFMVDGMMLKVASSLDFEMTSMYNVTIEGTTPINASVMVTQTIAVMVTDVNEVPMFTNMAYMAGVANGATAGTDVLTVTATDPEMNAITYGITGDSDSDFMIDAMGEIKVATGKTLNQTAKCQYMFMVTATDNATVPLTAMANVTINVGTCPENSGVQIAAGVLTLFGTLLYAVL